MLLGLSLLVNAQTPDKPANPAPPTASGAAPAPVQKADAKAVTRKSSIVDEVIKMSQGGISAEVIKAYIDGWQKPYTLSAADLITLKEHSVPDEIATAIIRRGGALANEAILAKNVPAQSVSGTPRGYTVVDPESYEYFNYYYLYPRTLAAANQRFYSSGTSYSPFLYGYAPPVFYPLRPLGIRRR